MCEGLHAAITVNNVKNWVLKNGGMDVLATFLAKSLYVEVCDVLEIVQYYCLHEEMP